MKIGIIGGGSIGLLFAHYLNKHHEVRVYVRTKKQADKLESEGLILERENKIYKNAVNASLFEEWDGAEDLTIIAVKQYKLPEIFPKFQRIHNNNTSFLFLQNGMGHLKWLDELNDFNVYVGIVEHGALKADANRVIHTGTGKTKMAKFSGASELILKEMADSASEFFPFILESNFEEMLIQKLIVNAVINPLTAVLEIPNGELLENPHYFQVFKGLFDEVSDALNIKDKEKNFLHLKDVCRKTGANRSSMLRDIEGNQQTEVDAILGYVLEKANIREMRLPLAENFYHLIKGKEYIKGEGK